MHSSCSLHHAWFSRVGCKPTGPTVTGDAVEATCTTRPDPSNDPRAHEIVDYVHVHSSHARVSRVPPGQPTSMETVPRQRRQSTINHGTPARQRAFYSIPDDQRAHNGMHGTHFESFVIVIACSLSSITCVMSLAHPQIRICRWCGDVELSVST